MDAPDLATALEPRFPEVADKAGHYEFVNSSVARATLQIELAGRAPFEVVAPVSAFELGGHERAFPVPIQPYPD